MTTALVPVTGADDDRDSWQEARASRVTASEVHDIAVGGRATWLRILADKLNGRAFQGNAETARGHEREPYLLAFLDEFVLQACTPNGRLFVSPVNERIGATPDALGISDVSERVGVEVKSHNASWTRDDIPPAHYDQMQLGMYVIGADRWLYAWEVMGDDGEPTLDDPRHVWVDRDPRRIAVLVREAENFLAWWDAGAPVTDDLPAELDDALAVWADARARKKDAEADEKGAEAIIRAHIEAVPGAADEGLKLAGRAASFVYTVTDKDVLDPDAWADAEPESHAGWVDLQARVKAGADAAQTLYHKTARSTRLNLTPTKGAT